jgi:hypothetical protein
MFDKMSKGQKALTAYGVCFLAYGAMFLGPMVGLPAADEKFFGKKGGALTQSAAAWTGLGAIVLGLDNIWAAQKGSKNIVSWFVASNAFGCAMRLGEFAAQGSTAWGGELVAAEYTQGLLITLTFFVTAKWCMLDGLGKIKNPIMSCDSLTHGSLLFVFFFYSAYIMMFFFTDFVSAQYVVPKGGMEPLVRPFMAWNLSMWTFVTANIALVLAAGSAKEQRQFALVRTTCVLASLYFMHAEAALAVPAELTKGYVGQTLALAALLAAGFGDKIKPAKKAKKAPAKAASKKRR